VRLHGFLYFVGHIDEEVTREDNKVFICRVTSVVVRVVAQGISFI